MHAIYFSPGSHELFLVDAPTFEATAAPSLIGRLRALGWPARARILSARAPHVASAVPGMAVELVDALPLLAQTLSGDADGAALSWAPALAAWQMAARLGLELCQRERLSIKLTARGRSGAHSGFDARWRVCAQTGEERAALLRIAAEFPAEIAVLEEHGRSPAISGVTTGARLLQRFIDACADVLVREASRRGALVRLKDWPATCWEQRLVRALGEDRARFFWDPTEAAALASELNTWAEDQLMTPMLSFLASPGCWTAPEPLAAVQRRLVRPAARLAETLLSGHLAPRTLQHPAEPRPRIAA